MLQPSTLPGWLVGMIVAGGIFALIQDAGAELLLRENASKCEIRTVMTNRQQPDCPGIHAAIHADHAIEPGSTLFDISPGIELRFKSIADKQDIRFNGVRGKAQGMIVTFELNSARLSDGARAMLDTMGEVMNSDMKTSSYTIVGNTDISGPYDYNKRLSRERAISVVRHLVLNNNVDKMRLQFDGVGPDWPNNPVHPEDPGNRRVVFFLHENAKSGGH